MDDEPDTLEVMCQLLRLEGFGVEAAGSFAAAAFALENTPPDIVLTDLHMPNGDGLDVLHSAQAKSLPVVIFTGSPDAEKAATALREGASDCLSKPLDFDALKLAVERAVSERRRVSGVQPSELRREEGWGGLVGTSPAMRAVYHLAEQVASSQARVLVTGETGTGKGELARAIHARSRRSDKPFVAVHCAALAESLLESELFGHEKGAFTGADRRRAGRFEQANGGTLFLDEVGEISAATQIKLLRTLQERTYERVGGNEVLTTDVRIIAATHRNLRQDIAEGRFREDLYYRLNVVQIPMPPLRTRGDDVLALAERCLRRFAEAHGKVVTGFTEGARRNLLAHDWPGNVRELENTVERATVLCEGRVIDEETLQLGTAREAASTLRIPGMTLAEIERHAILATLEAAGNSTKKAAEVLGVSIRTLQYRLQEYGAARSRRA